MLNVIMLIMLNVIMLSVVMLSLVMLNVIMLSVVMLNVSWGHANNVLRASSLKLFPLEAWRILSCSDEIVHVGN